VQSTYPLYLIPLLPLLGAAVNLTVGHRMPRWFVHLVACGSVLASFIITAIAGWDLYGLWKVHHATGRPEVVNHVFDWIQSGSLSISLSFLMDPLSAVMTFTVTFVGFLIHLYSTGYMGHDKRPAAYFGYLNLFTGAMLILVLGDSLPVLFIGWEGVGLCSYLLIGFWFNKEANANAGRKAFITNRIGDFGFLLGIFLLWSATGKMDYAGLRAADLGMPLLNAGGASLAFWAGLLLFVGATGKSAQIPLYVWLPDAMAGPTPVSALIHAATMVTAGVYMIARLNFLYMAAPSVMMIVAGVGAATALFAALIGFAQRDIKKVLAYSTISQLGFMFVGVGVGAFSAGIFHLFTHAFFKAGLFLGAGSVMHAMGDRTDIMGMGGLGKKIPITRFTFWVYCLAISGIPIFSGFFSKDEILLAAETARLAGWPAWYGPFLWGVLSAAALGTAFYMWRLYFLVFSGESRADAHTQEHIHESPWTMTVPLIVLALGATALGVLGLPHLGGLHNYFTEWLAPSLTAQHDHAPNATTTVIFMVVATTLAVLGIGFAWLLYRKGPEGAAGVAKALGPLRRAAENKFYVDEIYDFLIIRPFKYLCAVLYAFFDKVVIDLIFVNGSAFVVGTTGRIARAWQNGDVQRYLWAMVVGIGLIVGAARCFNAPKVRVEQQSGNHAVLVAEVGSGAGEGKTKIEWDVTGDGKADAQYAGQRRVEVDFAGPGKHVVTAWITDGLFGKTRKVKHTLTVGEGAR
jgi:NADH-quinone oxidoreductase subunit L